MRILGTTPMLKPWFSITALLLVACASEPVGKKDLLAFLTDGKTTRVEVEQHLGQRPSNAPTFENGRIVFYRISENESGYSLRPGKISQYTHSLVLVFDRQDRLEQHALVKVR